MIGMNLLLISVLRIDVLICVMLLMKLSLVFLCGVMCSMLLFLLERFVVVLFSCCSLLIRCLLIWFVSIILMMCIVLWLVMCSLLRKCVLRLRCLSVLVILGLLLCMRIGVIFECCSSVMLVSSVLYELVVIVCLLNLMIMCWLC